jgi:alginate O-acetyltransferase complex protein AlgJ
VDNNMHDSTRGHKVEEHAAGVTMVALMVWGLWQVAVALQDPAVHDISWSLDDFRSGKATNQFSTHIDKKIPAREDLIAWSNAGRYLVTRGAGDQVRLGRDGWLFSVEEIQFYPDHAQNLQHRVAMMGQISQALQKQGVDLVVAVVPDKARVHAPLLTTGTYPHWYAPRYEQILGTARQAGVAVVDLGAALREASASAPLYYRTDTHWNQQGAQRSAQAIAEQAAKRSATWPTVTFEVQAQGAAQDRVGDLLKMMSLGDMPNWARPTPDSEIAQELQKKSASAAPAGLFDDASVSVVLVGSSYSQRANFHGYLQQALQADVLNVAKDGGGFLQSLAEYVSDQSFQSSKPQLIIWEVPERVFSQPLTEQEKKGLAL